MMQMMFHGLPLNTPFVAASHEDELRQLCGVLVKAPQFMLGGLSPEHAMPASPIQLSVCFPDEPCGYRDICLGYSFALAPGSPERRGRAARIQSKSMLRAASTALLPMATARTVTLRPSARLASLPPWYCTELPA